jgi:DNA-binding NarL/FixJ family response regulator
MQLLYKLAADGLDAIFIDLNMPRKNGVECLDEIRGLPALKETPVIIVSTSLDAKMVERLYHRGASFYIQKPSDFGSLKKLLSKVMDLIFQPLPVPLDKFLVNSLF